MGLDISFWVLAAVSVSAAVAVVMLKNVFRAALTLILCFLSIGGIYATLQADFLAAAQVIIYVGGISVLIILAVMLTRDVQQGSPSNNFRLPALIISLAFAAVLICAVVNTMWPASAVPPAEQTTAVLGDRLLGEGGFLLAVEIAGVLLLAAIVGAVALVREK